MGGRWPCCRLRISTFIILPMGAILTLTIVNFLNADLIFHVRHWFKLEVEKNEIGRETTITAMEMMDISNARQKEDFGMEIKESPSRANAVIVVLARNSELEKVVGTLAEFEEYFKKQYNYPYVFLNEFDENFTRNITNLLAGNGSEPINRNFTFSLIPAEQWSYPAWIDQKLAMDNGQKVAQTYGIANAARMGYHFMCRYFSGFLHRHPLLQQYDFYWRVEPGARYHCRVDYDPFLFMLEHNKTYGFIQVMPEMLETAPTLRNTTVKFFQEVYPSLNVTQYPSLALLMNDKAPVLQNSLSESLDRGLLNWTDGCHFWNNFEIARFDFFRSSNYQRYFDYLDQAGGVFYERWGDAPVHSLAVGMILEKSQIHHFRDIIYSHDTVIWCPVDDDPSIAERRRKCDANTKWNTAYPDRMQWGCVGLPKRFD